MHAHAVSLGDLIVARLYCIWSLSSTVPWLLYQPVLGHRLSPVMVDHVSWAPQAAWASVPQAAWASVLISFRTSITRICRRVLGNRVRPMWHRASVVQTVKLGHERWVPRNTPVIIKTSRGRGRPKSQSAHACGVDSLTGCDMSKESWKPRLPIRVRVSKGSCMHGTWIVRARPERMAPEIWCTSWYQVAILLEVALQQGETYTLDYTKIG